MILHRCSIKKMFLALLALLSVVATQAQTIRTVGSGGNFSTLRAAFTAINNGSISGSITLQVISNITETASASLNASGSGSANYSSITIFPTGVFTISGTINGAIINLNGADNITIDGRINMSGSTQSLTIRNLRTGGGSTNSVIRFIGTAESNTIRYCNLRSSGSSSATGTILFGTASSGIGNSNNVVEHNTFSNSGGNRPTNVIFSSGTSGFGNRNNIIRDNHFFNFLNPDESSHGVFVASNSFNWTISGNSFYETSAFSPSNDGRLFYVIRINNTSGNDFTVSGNFIGGSAPQCGGSAWTFNPVENHRLFCIHLAVGTGSHNTVQGNIIRNIRNQSTHANAFYGIFVSSGNIDIGTVTGNSIGSSTGTGSIVLGNTSAHSINYGIFISGSGSVNVQNNVVGSVTTIGSSSISHSFIAIYKDGGGAISINNNWIGSETTVNSIHASSASISSTPQNVYGIQSLGTGVVEINGNIISNLRNAYAPSSSSSGQVVGIITSGTGVYTISDNQVFNLSTTSPNTSTTTAASVIGISSPTTGAGKTVSGNIIYNLQSTAPSAAVSVVGIYYDGSTSGNNLVYGNFIHSLSVSSTSTSAIIAGLRIASGLTTYYNNIISIGTGVNNPCLIYGIYETGSAGHNINLYFNTVYLGGNPNGNTSTYAYWNNSNSNARNIRNNLFINTRSNAGGTAKHYAIRLAGITNLTIDYNNYFAPGSGGVLGLLTTDRTTLAAWRTATGQDANSFNTNPVFQNAGGTLAQNYKPLETLPGTAITGIETDYLGEARMFPPSVGALETGFISSASNTFVAGDIFTDFGFQALPGNSICPGLLTVTVPPGAIITGVSVEYRMTAQNGAIMSQQRSQLRCVSPGGTSETSIISGSGNSAGTLYYNRTGLNIANNVPGGGNLQFELHAGRTWGGTGCNMTFNYVNNNSWTVTVYYYTLGVFADFLANRTNVIIGETLSFTDLSGGGSINSWLWNFGSGAVPATANTQGPHNVYYTSPGRKTVSLTVNGTITENKTNYISVIPPGDWLRWDNGINSHAYGYLIFPGSFQVAARFEPSDIAQYYSHQITRMRFYVRDLPDAAQLKIWQGTSQANLVEVYSQPFSPVPNSWIEVELNTPYYIDSALELWFGAEYDDPGTGYYIAGIDQTTSNNGKGNMIRHLSGGNQSWTTLDVHGISGVWNVQAYLIPVGIWTGNISSAWDVEGNWSSFLLPGAGNRVIIPPVLNDPVIGTSVEVSRIHILSDASLSIDAAGELSVSEQIVNNSGVGGLIIISNALGTGSLIHSNSGVQASFQRYVPGEAEAWHLLSSPVSQQEISGNFTPPGTYGDGTGYDFYHWHEPDTSWIYFNHPSNWAATHGNNYFTVGRGYLVSYQELNPTKTFTGELNSEKIYISVNKTIGTGPVFGANLVGNPYPSSVDWKAPAGWDRTPLQSNGGGYDIWIWNDAEYNYGVYNSASSIDEGTLGVTRYIAPTQGFFVQARQTGAIEVSDPVRVHVGSDNWLKTKSDVPYILHLSVKSLENNGSDEVLIEFEQTEQQAGIEKKFSFIDKAPSLFIRQNNRNYSWIFLEDMESWPVLPLSFKAGASGSYMLTAGFDPNYYHMIYLIDLETNTRHDFKSNSSYQFKAETKGLTGRFVLQFFPGVFGNPHDNMPLHIYSIGRQVYIDLRLLSNIYRCEVYDIGGRTVFSSDYAGGAIHEFGLNTRGLHIVRITGKEGVRSQKLLIF